MKTRTFLMGIVCVGLLTPSLCFGWGKEGHQIVGEIAWQELKPATKQAVRDLLETDAREKYHTLFGATLWADDTKNSTTGPWHYVNFEPGATDYDKDRDCPDDSCVVEKIKKYAGVLGDETESTDKRLKALKYIAHFVGDIHQPLHAGHEEDRGGNSIHPKFFGATKKLHGVWDTNIILRRMGDDSWQALATELHAAITDEHREEWTAEMDVVEWANDSYLLAVSHAYKHPTAHRPIRDGDELRSVYYDRNLPVIEEQLKVAGVRLAKMVDDILAP